MRLRSIGAACKGTTQKGKPCQVVDIFENGYCEHHGGKGRLIRHIRAMDKALKRSKRHDRKMNALMKKSPGLRALMERIKASNEKKKADANLRSEEPAGSALPVQDAVQGNEM